MVHVVRSCSCLWRVPLSSGGTPSQHPNFCRLVISLHALPASSPFLATPRRAPTVAYGRGPARTLMSLRCTAPSPGRNTAARCIIASTTASGAAPSHHANSRLLPTSRVPLALVVAVNVMSAGSPLSLVVVLLLLLVLLLLPDNAVLLL